MKKFIKFYLFIGVLLFAGLAVSQAQVQGEESFRSFNGVKISGPINVELIKISSVDKTRITYESHTMHTSQLKSEVDKSGILNIRHKASKDNPDTLNMKIYYYHIDRVVVEGASVKIKGTLSSRSMDMKLTSGAHLSGAIDVKDMVAEVRGSSEMRISGSSRYLDVAVNSSKLIAPNLRVMSARVNAESRAWVKLHVTERLEAVASMANIYYLGEPEFIRGGTSPFGGEILSVKE